MKIAILGARGFLGSYLTNYFTEQRRYTVLPVTRQTVDLENFNQVDYWLASNQPDVVINCAISGGGTRVNDINYSDVQRDLTVFLNFYNSKHVKKYINIGSGAEFDRRLPIGKADEKDILHCRPLESYGFVKNTIARMCLEKGNFYTLRLFGCFDSSEPANRLFKKFLANDEITVEDKFFDYISASDFARIVQAYCEPKYWPKDINCVYTEKYKLSQLLQMLSPRARINVSNATLANSYTGSGAKLAALPIQLEGLVKGLKEYE